MSLRDISHERWFVHIQYIERWDRMEFDMKLLGNTQKHSKKSLILKTVVTLHLKLDMDGNVINTNLLGGVSLGSVHFKQTSSNKAASREKYSHLFHNQRIRERGRVHKNYKTGSKKSHTLPNSLSSKVLLFGCTLEKETEEVFWRMKKIDCL